MSGALEFHDPEFIARLAGLYHDFERLGQSVGAIIDGANRRVESIRRNGFLRCAEIGEALLAIDAQHPGEFTDWFAAHRLALGFSLRTAERCKAAARLIVEHGLDRALLIVLGNADRARPEPFLSLRLSLPVSPEQVPTDQIPELLDRIRPAVEVYDALSKRALSA